MLNYIIDFSIKNKLVVILFTLTIAAFGLFSITQIPVGAVPDITNNQVQVITVSTNLSTQDVEQFITYPVELEMTNLPGVKEIRSISKFGLSVVTIVFNDNMGTYLPRQLIAEKIKSAAANIPEGFGTPEMGPITTGLGEIYQYILDVKPGYENQYSPMELRTIQDWIVKRQLSGIPGVVEVNTWGGYLKQYEVAIDPEKLKSFDVTLIEVFDALNKNNSVAGGAYIEKQNQSYFIRGDGMVKTTDDIGSIIVKNNRGIPVLVRDIAEVHFGYANRFGAITANGEGEKVLGQIMMLKNANSKKVISDVKKRVAEVQKSLPEGVFINPVVERGELIAKTSLTVVENLLIGCFIVILIVYLLLGNIRTALVIASTIPLALLFTISLMYIFGIDANLMSLGALDFGIIIDGAVIIVEFIAFRITSEKLRYENSSGEDRRALVDQITAGGASRMMNSAVYGQFIILIVLIPILSLSGVEGKMFRPMALSFSFAILGAMVLGLTWLPVASSIFLKPQKEKKKRNITGWIMDTAYRSYSPVIRWAYDHKKLIFGAALASLALAVFLFSRIGGEFVPTLDEGDFVIQPVLKTGTSLSKTIEVTTRMEKILKSGFPEVQQVVCRIGAAEVPTDPMSMEEIDMIIKLKPKKEWVSAKTKEGLAEKFKEALMVIPGVDYEFTQPIEMRFNELITGVRADIAVKVFGEDLNYLNQKAVEIKNKIEGIPGAADIILEKTAGLPQMSVKFNRSKLAYYGLNVSDLNKYLTMAFGGEMAGSVFEGEKRFDMAIRFKGDYRENIDNIRQVNVGMLNNTQIPFAELADISYTVGPAKISRDNTHRRIVVSVNVRNRDLQSVVNDIQARLAGIDLKPGYYISYGGQFENLQNATRRLKVAVPVSLLLIFIFLHFAFKSFKEAAIIFSAVPLSAVGGVLLLWIRGMPFSVSAGIGFIALFGVAVLNGIVLIEHLKELKEKKEITDIREIVFQGAKDRLRPVMLTAAAAAMGFLPMAVSTSAGAEVQRPLATVVIGGLFTSTMLTMLAVPLLYAVFVNVKGIQLWPLGFKRIKPVVTVFLLAFVPLMSFGQKKDMSLDSAINIAIDNNKELAAYELKIRQAKALIPSAWAIDKTSFYYGYDENNIAENGYPLDVVGVEQRFDFPTVYTSQRRANRIGLRISGIEYELRKRILVRKVSQSWYEILYYLNRQKLIEYIDSLYRNFTNAAEKKYRLGETNNLERLNALAKHQQVLVLKKQVNTDLQIALNNLKSIMQYDEDFSMPYDSLTEILPKETVPDPGLDMMSETVRHQQTQLQVERNYLLPDINLSIFNGTNRFADSKNYLGYNIGLGIPVFFGEQRSKIRSGKQAVAIAETNLGNYKTVYQGKKYGLEQEIAKYRESVGYYQSAGKQLAEEIIKSAERSYTLGEIDFFRFIQSIENAISIREENLNNLYKLNNLVLELNYLTIL